MRLRVGKSNNAEEYYMGDWEQIFCPTEYMSRHLDLSGKVLKRDYCFTMCMSWEKNKESAFQMGGAFEFGSGKLKSRTKLPYGDLEAKITCKYRDIGPTWVCW